MYLLIDMSELDKIHLSLFDEQEKYSEVYDVRNRELLSCVHNLLIKKSLEIGSVAGVAVVVGEGSFTSTRIATTLANTVGYVLRIPLLSITKPESVDLSTLINRLKKVPVGQLIHAKYSGEPNIGQIKK